MTKRLNTIFGDNIALLEIYKHGFAGNFVFDWEHKCIKEGKNTGSKFDSNAITLAKV